MRSASLRIGRGWGQIIKIPKTGFSLQKQVKEGHLFLFEVDFAFIVLQTKITGHLSLGICMPAYFT